MKNLKKIVNSDAAYEILDSSNCAGSTWTEGGCAILAQALNRLKGYPIYAIYNSSIEGVEHFGVMTPSGSILDADGEHRSAEAWLQFFKDNEMPIAGGLSVVPFSSKIGFQGINFDSEASDKLAELIKNHNMIRETVRSVLMKESVFNEELKVAQNTLQIIEPYDNIQKINLGNKVVYILFGDVDYYQNKESIKAIKRKSNEINLDHNSYQQFLKEFKKRFYSIPELKNSDIIISIETTSVVTNEMAESIGKPYISSGFKKQNPLFKMKDIDLEKRHGITGIFNINFNPSNDKKICIIDDFITTGTSFKNAFDILPDDIDTVGVCLFRLNS